MKIFQLRFQLLCVQLSDSLVQSLLGKLFFFILDSVNAIISRFVQFFLSNVQKSSGCFDSEKVLNEVKTVIYFKFF